MSEEGKGNDADVIIVGGGCSGLAAAYHIKIRRPDERILVLEAKGKFSFI